MSEITNRNINLILPRVQLDDFFVYDIQFSMANSTDSDNFELNVGDKDFLCVNPKVTMFDANGIHFPEASMAATALDSFTLDITSIDDKKFMSNPIDIWTLNDLANNPYFQGMFFRSRTKYNFQIAGDLGLTKGTYPMYFRLELIGYKLNRV